MAVRRIMDGGAFRSSACPTTRNVKALISAHVEMQDDMWGRTGKNSDPLYQSTKMRINLAGIKELFQQRASTAQIEQWGSKFFRRVKVEIYSFYTLPSLISSIVNGGWNCCRGPIVHIQQS